MVAVLVVLAWFVVSCWFCFVSWLLDLGFCEVCLILQSTLVLLSNWMSDFM